MKQRLNFLSRGRSLTFYFLTAFLISSGIATDLSVAAQSRNTSAYRIAYRLSMPQPASHLFEVTMQVQIPTAVDHVDFQMPRWSPGRYAVFDFAKNVQEFHSLNSSSNLSLPVIRLDDQTWRVITNKEPLKEISVTYKVFAYDLSGTFSYLDSRHANFNGGSIFMYVVDHKPDPVTLEINAPRDWRIMNGYLVKPDQNQWVFANYDLMIDTPTVINPVWTLDSFTLGEKTYRVVVTSLGDEGGKRPALIKDIEKIVRAETAMWGAPEFDTYTFLITFAADGQSGDGMEHLNSTQVILPGALGDQGMYEGALGTAAHEFFHVWNVKRLRPLELGPWDFTRPVNTRSLWVAEGFTNYYGHLMQRRAGLWTDTKVLETYGNAISSIENSPGSRLMSAEDSSLLAPYLDGARHAQRTNLANTSVSYYPKGEVIGLTLDLTIRGLTRGRASLDDVMRRMYDEFYMKSANATYYLHGRGYTSEDLERVTSRIAGKDMHDFFTRYIRGVQAPPYMEALEVVGLRFIKAPAQMAYTAGITLERRDPLVRIGAINQASAAESAGLQVGDVITTIDTINVTQNNWRESLNKFKSGETVPISVQRGGKAVNVTLKLGAPDLYDYRIEEQSDASPEAKALRTAWLNGTTF